VELTGRTLSEVEESLAMPFVDVVTTQRAVRRVHSDPVDDAIVLRCLELALKAPTGSNGQNWEFVVVKDREIKRRLARRYREAWVPYKALADRAVKHDEAMQRLLAAVQWQIDNFVDIPVVVVPCLRGSGSYNLPKMPDRLLPTVMVSSYYGSIYPSVQNLLLAARAAGLGASLITLPVWRGGSVRRMLKLPRNVRPICAVPLGWPRGRYGPTTRRPVGDVVHLDRFGDQPWTAKT
jgi:F420 biosynthesis protein FbiB-like protein